MAWVSRRAARTDRTRAAALLWGGWVLVTGLVLSVAMIAWDILLAGRIAKLRRIPRGFQAITGIAGLLLVPALVVAYTAQSLLYGRAIILVSWLWAAGLALAFAGAAATA